MNFEEAIKRVTQRPGVEVMTADAVAKKLTTFSGNSSELQSLGDGAIVGIRMDMLRGTVQEFNGRKAEIISVPILFIPKGQDKAVIRVVATGSLLRQDPEADFEPGHVLQTGTFASDGEFLKILHDHVGDGAENSALPAKHIEVRQIVLKKDFGERKGVNVKYHALYLRG
ncbi:MAG: hypothetical protein ACRCX2_00380 [Paraclostridium sp.]